MKSKEIDGKISSILERNAKVELDKAWETSIARRVTLAIATYAAVLYFLIVIGAQNPHLAAIIPAGGYLLQQYSMPFLKSIWTKKFYKK